MTYLLLVIFLTDTNATAAQMGPFSTLEACQEAKTWVDGIYAKRLKGDVETDCTSQSGHK